MSTSQRTRAGLLRRSAALLGVVGFANALSGHAAELNVRVLDRHARPVADTVVAAAPVGGLPESRRRGAAPGKNTRRAVMDQVNQQFVPHVLVVETGTAVTFPNSDNVSHQVYSFSPAKRFTLPLYRGQTAAPVIFDKPGLVVLGCNIHDSMIAYVYVTSSPYFGKTDDKGRLKLDALPAGDYDVTVWSPAFNEPQAEIKRRTQVTAQPAASVDIALTRELKVEPRHQPGNNNEHY